MRIAAGVVEIGTVSIAAQGDIINDGFWPYAPLSQGSSQFDGGTFSAASVAEDASENFFTIQETDNSNDVVFGTCSGRFAVDTGYGTILGLPKSASKSFDPSSAGTYTAIYYEKANAQTGQGNVEAGTPSQGTATITVGSNGSITTAESQGKTVASGILVTAADSSYIYDGATRALSDPCLGLFTVRTTTGSFQLDLFVSFQRNVAIFSSFRPPCPS